MRKNIDILTTSTTRDINRAVQEGEYLATLMENPTVPPTYQEYIRCFLIASCNKIAKHLSDRRNEPPIGQMVREIYPWGRLVYGEDMRKALTILLADFERDTPGIVPSKLKRYALTKAQFAENEKDHKTIELKL